MKLRILGTALEGGEPKQYASSYLVNDVLAVDAGCLGFWRSPDDQAGIRHILITHTHLDHIASLPMFIENAYRPGLDSVTVYGLGETVEALQRHVFNDVIWPDFVKITTGRKTFRAVAAHQSRGAVPDGGTDGDAPFVSTTSCPPADSS